MTRRNYPDEMAKTVLETVTPLHEADRVTGEHSGTRAQA